MFWLIDIEVTPFSSIADIDAAISNVESLTDDLDQPQIAEALALLAGIKAQALSRAQANPA
jgi:hypothetical protein